MVTSTAPLGKLHPTVIHMLAEAASLSPDGEALVCQDRRMTYRDYLSCVAGFAHELKGLGVGGGQVATILANSIEACIANFAAQAAGAQLVPLNPLYTARELGFILADAVPRVLIVDAALRDLAETLARDVGIAHLIVLGQGVRLLDEWRGQDVALPLPLPEPDAPGLLQYTGGTTGRPKGVNLTHRAVATNVAQREGILPTKVETERVLCVLPLFHSYAMHMAWYLAANARGCMVILPRYRPDDLLRTIVAEKITIFPGSPTIFIGLMGHADFAKTDWSRVHTCYSGSAPLSEETLKAWQQAVGCFILEGYGQTEAGPIVSYNPPAAPKVGSCGLVLARTEAQIVDVEQGNSVLGTGEVGEIRVRGPQVMTEYRNLPDETASTLRDGWLYTGDIGEFDADGYLFIRDRKKDMAIVGGYNVYPREIDEVLFMHPGVQDAASVGVPDSYRGEVIWAYVVAKAGIALTDEDVLAHCRANLAKYKVPARVRVVAALPKTTVSKTDKKALRALAAEAKASE
jgi:long-chain acyl-CoA synthetase